MRMEDLAVGAGVIEELGDRYISARIAEHGESRIEQDGGKRGKLARGRQWMQSSRLMPPEIAVSRS